MDKHQKMLEAFVENIKANYSSDVGMAIVYGSYVTKTMHELSDVDVMFVGKTQRAYELQKQFIYEGIGYDFFCMPIDRVHKIIEEYSPIISIIAEGQLIYVDTDEKKGHFDALQKRFKTLYETEPVNKYFNQVETVLKDLKAMAFDHQFASIERKVHLQGQMIYSLMHYLQLLNRKHFKYGTKQVFDEVQAMELKPKTVLYYLELLQKETVNSNEIMTLVNTLNHYYDELKRTYQDPFDVESLKGFYEEGVSTWNKLIDAAKVDDISTAFLAATSLENELSHYRLYYPDLPFLFSNYQSDVSSLLESAKVAEIAFLHILKTEHIDILAFQSLEEVITYLKS
jgi:predicted nucleotidyltransferase